MNSCYFTKKCVLVSEHDMNWNYPNFKEIQRIGHQSAVFRWNNLNSLELYLFHRNSTQKRDIYWNYSVPNKFNKLDTKTHFFDELTWIIPTSKKLDSRTWNLLELFWFKRNSTNWTPKRSFLVNFRDLTKKRRFGVQNTIFTGIILISKKFNELDTKTHFFGELTWIHLNYTYFTETRHKNVIFTSE